MMYIPGKEIGGTDALSRYGVRHDECEPSVRKHLVSLMTNSPFAEAENESEELICLVKDSQYPLSWMEVKQESSIDDTCRKLIAWVTDSSKNEIEDESLKQFRRYKTDLLVQDGVV